MPVHLVGPNLPGAVDAAPQLTPGSMLEDENSNAYVYAKGVALTVAGDAVVFDAAWQSTRTLVATRGPVGIATAATVANTWGWYLVRGRMNANGLTAVAANTPLFSTVTPGSVDDAVVATAKIDNAYAVAASGGAGAVAVFVNFPFMSGAG